MTKCPVCDQDMEDETVCPRCGTDVADLLRPSPSLSVAGVDGPLVDLRCERCGKGDLILVTDETDIPRYRCPRCRSYRGEFMHTGMETYYSTNELKVGQFIDTRIKMTGDFTLPLENHMDHLAREISEATSMSTEQAASAIKYLEKRRIITITEKDGHIEVQLT